MQSVIEENAVDVLVHQLKNYWLRLNIDSIEKAANVAFENYYADEDRYKFNYLHTLTWMIFLYRVSYILGKNGHIREADAVYYLNKIMHGVDWYHQVKLPRYFKAEHPLGSVLGRAIYGEYLFVYQGTTVGGNRKNDKIYYPVLGDNVLLYANATILGNTKIGNNVVVSANTYIINEVIPDNSIVFGRSPELIIKSNEDYVMNLTKHLWM